MSAAILERQMHIGTNGTVVLHLPAALCGKDVEIQVHAMAAPPTEAELVARINRPLESSLRKRYEALMARRIAETLTAKEYEELQNLTDAVEADHLQRWESVATLAALRERTPQAVAAQFGLAYPF